MTATTVALNTRPRLIEIRRHQVYRLNRSSRGGLLARLRRGLRARFAHA